MSVDLAAENAVGRAVRAVCLACDLPDVRRWAGGWLSGSDRSRSGAVAALRGVRWNAANGRLRVVAAIESAVALADGRLVAAMTSVRLAAWLDVGLSLEGRDRALASERDRQRIEAETGSVPARSVVASCDRCE